MTKKELLPPGVYNVVIDRVRKIRNKPMKRVHMTVVETGQKITKILKEE